MGGMASPGSDFLISPELPAAITGVATRISLRHRLDRIPDGLLWRIDGPQSGCLFHPVPAAWPQPIEATFSVAGVHHLRARGHADPAAFLAHRAYPVFEPGCDEMIRALHARDEFTAMRRFKGLLADCRGDVASRDGLMAKMEHLLVQPELTKLVLALLLEAPHVRSLLEMRARGYDMKLGHVDDLIQELYLKMLPAISRFRPEGHFEAYAARALENLYRTLCRRDRRRPAGVGPGQVLGVDGLLESELPGESEAREAFNRGELQRKLGVLADLEFRLFVSRTCFDMTFARLADLMGVPDRLKPQTRVSQARRAFQAILDKLRGDDEAPPAKTEGRIR